MPKSEGDAQRVKTVMESSSVAGLRKASTVKGVTVTQEGYSEPMLPSSEIRTPLQKCEGESIERTKITPVQVRKPVNSADSPLTALQATANRHLQEAKKQLEQSGNIKTSIKEKVTDHLFSLYQIVLRLNDSRRTLQNELQKQKAKHMEEMMTQRNEQIRQLTELTANNQGMDCSKQVGAIRMEVEALRKTIESDVVKQLADSQKSVANAEEGKVYGDLIKEMRKMSRDLECMKSEVKDYKEELKGLTGDGTASALEQVVKEVRAIRQERRSYSEVLRAPVIPSPPSTQHTVIITSQDPHHTADEIIKKIETTANVRKEGIRVDRCRKAKDGKVIIGCSSAEDAHKLSDRLRGSDLTIEQAKPKNPLVEIRNVLAVNTDAEIAESILNQNQHVTGALEMAQESLCIRFRRKARNSLEIHVVLEVSPRLWKKMIEAGKLYIGMQRREVVDRSPLVQCSSCLGYGHTRRLCREKSETCAYCAGKHERGKCEARLRFDMPRCINCTGRQGGHGEGEAHTAFSEECPVRRRWDSIARSRVAYC